MANLGESHGCNTFLFMVLVCASNLAFAAGWVSMGGPLGGLGYDVRIHPGDKNVMYVTDNFAGVSKTIDNGQTWSPSNSGITTKGGTSGDAVNIFSLTLDPNNPNTIWAGTFGDGQAFGVFKSTDGGTTWTRKNNGMTLGGNFALIFRGFTIQQGNSNVVYAQAEVRTTPDLNGWQFFRSKGRVYKTVDGGENWQLIWEGNALARYLIIDPGNPNILYVSHGIFDIEPFDSDCKNGVYAGLGVLKSSDAGQTWSAINNGLTDLTVGSLRMHPTNSQILFAATGNIACSGFGTANVLSGVFKTTNGGALWTKVITAHDGEPFTVVNFSPSNPNTVYVGSPLAFYRSDDLGSTWTARQKTGFPMWGPPGIGAGFPIDAVVDPDNANTLYANNYAGGVFRSADGAATWESWSKGYTGDGVRRMAISAGNPAGLATIGKSGPFISLDYGRNWVGIFNGDAAHKTGNVWDTVAVHPTNSSVILLADAFYGYIFRSSDNGNSFTQVLKEVNAANTTPNQNIPTKFQGFRGLAYAPSNPNIVYAGLSVDTHYYSPTPTGTVIYKSVDGGNTFAAMPSVVDGNNVNRLVVDSSDANKVYAATSNGVYKSADGAASWTHASALGSRKIEALAAKSGTVIAGEVAGGVWISSDDGATWSGPNNTGISSPNPYIAALTFDAGNANVVYAGDLYSGAYRSSDKGLSWSPFPDASMTGLTNRAINDLVSTSEVLYAATEGGGVFRYDFAPTTAPTCALTATPSSVSQGGSATLTATCSPSTTAYTWTGSGCAGTTAASCQVTPAATSTYTVAGTNTFGTGASASATVTVAVVKNPSDCIFDWAERTYPQLFAPAGAASASYAPYYLRYYSGTATYLATSSADNHVWVLGPATGYALFDVGPLTAFLGLAGCSQ